MMAERKLMIVLIRKESILVSWLRDASTFALFIALIGIGVYLESSALQWVGAIIGFIAILIKSAGQHKANTYDIAGARAELDRLEAEA